MPDAYVLTCLLCGRVENKGDIAEFHQHAIERHEISIDDLEVASVVVVGSLLWEWTLPDGRRWLRLEITGPNSSS